MLLDMRLVAHLRVLRIQCVGSCSEGGLAIKKLETNVAMPALPGFCPYFLVVIPSIRVHKQRWAGLAALMTSYSSPEAEGVEI